MFEEVKQLHKLHPKHWPYLRKRRLYNQDVSAKQIIAGQIFTVIFSIFGGLILERYKFHIIGFGGALILYPALIDLSASNGGALGAKLNHHIKETPYRIRSIILADVGFATFITITSAVILASVATIFGSFFIDIDAGKLILMALLSSIMISLVFYPIVVSVVIILLKRGLNPDNLVGPIESSVVDVLATIFIIISIGILS